MLFLVCGALTSSVRPDWLLDNSQKRMANKDIEDCKILYVCTARGVRALFAVGFTELLAGPSSRAKVFA